MAKDIKFILSCDPCSYHDIPGVPAVATHIVTIDGGPEMALDVCARDEQLFQEWLAIYKEQGRETAPQQTEAKKRKAKALSPPAPGQLESAAAEQEADEEEVREERFLLCPLPHTSKKGGPLRVNYNSRNTHAKTIHGKHIWEIDWEDPDHILTAFCNEHAFCNNVGFTSVSGLKQHAVSLRKHHPEAAARVGAPREEERRPTEDR